MIVRELITRLGFSVNDGNMRRYESGVNNIKRSAENAANSFRNMFAAFVGINALRSIINTADQMQSLQARIGMLPQTVGDVGEAFDEVAKKATESRTSVLAYGTLYVRLAGATKNFLSTQSDVLEVTSAISDALIVGGANAVEAASATLQLSQAFQKGKMDGDEFRSFMENMSTSVKSRLAEELGAKDAGDLFEMSSSGELTAKNLALAFKRMAPDIRKQMLQIPMTFGQATTIMGNKWDEFVNKLNRKSGTITSIAKFMLRGFDFVEEKIYKFIDFLGGSTQTIKLFGIVLAAAFAPAIISGFIGALTLLFSPAAILFGKLLLLALVLEDLYQYFTGGESVIGDFIEWLNSGSQAANFIKGILIGLGIVLGLLAASFTAAWVAALGPIGWIVLALMALYGTFLFFKDEVIKIMSDVWDSITERFDFMINNLKKGWQDFKASLGFGSKVDATVVAGAATSAGGTGGVTTQFGDQQITINQTLPPGSTPETAAAAAKATEMAAFAMSDARLARQMGQLQ